MSRDWLISEPYRICPRCGQRQQGVHSVSDSHYVRECRACGDVQLFDLPRPKKQIIYLDQWIWSGMKRALRQVKNNAPLTAEHEGYRDLFLRLDRLIKLMLIVCPVSPVHEAESRGLLRLAEPKGTAGHAVKHVESYEDLRRLHGHLAGGTRFEPSYRILARQIQTALPAWLRGEIPAAARPVEEAVCGKIHVWLPLFYGAMEAGFTVEELRAFMAGRIRLEEGLAAVVARWRQQSHCGFEDWFAQETTGLGRILESAYVARRPEIAAFEQRFGRMNDNLHPPSDTMLQIMHAIEDQDGPGDALPRARAFLASATFAALPAVRISSALWAGLAHRLVHGGMGTISASFASDVDFISSYLPYCDAMFIENACADMLATNPVRSRVPETTRVFSSRTQPAFISFLAQLESSASPAQTELVASIYGDEWDRPDLGAFLR